ncbi:hypothetical protein ACTWPT_08605 [Nonomuraea sp. 3N208]|uniref:hypothetical protein n=1 Tax=Nonomuraea sp. 3N208 TaxID=3457421 RepID=UPI003FCE04F6
MPATAATSTLSAAPTPITAEIDTPSTIRPPANAPSAIRGGMLFCTPAAAYHRRPDIRFVPVTGLPPSILGLPWVKAAETAAVRAFDEAAAGHALGVEALVA